MGVGQNNAFHIATHHEATSKGDDETVDLSDNKTGRAIGRHHKGMDKAATKARLRGRNRATSGELRVTTESGKLVQGTADGTVNPLLRYIAAALITLETAMGLFMIWGSTLGSGQVTCEWEAADTGGDCSTSPFQYGLFAVAVVGALIVLCAAAVLGVARFAERLPPWGTATLLGLVLALQLSWLGNWATGPLDYGPSGQGDLVEDIVSVLGVVFVSAVCTAAITRTVRPQPAPPQAG